MKKGRIAVGLNYESACALDGDVVIKLIGASSPVSLILWLAASDLSLSLFLLYKIKTLSLGFLGDRRKAVVEERTRAKEREERLHLHLNLAVDLAVVRGHRSCRGKGRL